MGEDFHGGVCGGMWWNPPRDLFSGGDAGGLTSLCSVAQLGGGVYDVMSSFGWPNEVLRKGKPTNNVIHNLEKNNLVCENSMVFQADLDSNLDMFCFEPSATSSTTDWNQPHLICNNGGNEGNCASILQDDVILPTLINSNNFSNNNSKGGSPPMALTASSNTSGHSSTITSSAASYLIQALFDDNDDDSQLINPNHGDMSSNDQFVPPCSWVKEISANNKLDGAMNMLINGGQGSNGHNYSTVTTLNNSLQSRSSRAHDFNKKSHSCANLVTMVNNEEILDSKSKVRDQPPTKRPRIETPSPLPTFKVRKEKIGDRITALQQLVSPFGKTDTASVLNEAIDYIKFLHDQVNVLSTPYLKNGAAIQHQQSSDTLKDEDQDLRRRGLCLVPLSSTYPVAQETPVDFLTPTFGGTTFR